MPKEVDLSWDRTSDGDAPRLAIVWERPSCHEELEHLAKRQANAAVALHRLGDPEPVWPLFRHRPDPGLRSHLIHRLKPLGADPTGLLQRLQKESDVSAQLAMILSLGEFSDKELPADIRRPLVAHLLERYRDDPDPGIHGAIDWLLRPSKEGDKPRPLDWGQAEALQRIDEERKGQPPGPRRWYVNNQGQTLAIIPEPVEFLMGSPVTEADRRDDEHRHRRRISRSFAIATKDVTVRQFQEFLRAHPEVGHGYPKKYSPEPEGPIIAVTWFEAAQYCRWLSEQDKSLTEDQYCYPTIAEIQRTANDPVGTPLKLPTDYLSRRGYRLPTEAEWEYACRFGARTSRAHGNSLALLPRYAWYLSNSQDRTWPVGQKKPNDLGMFDMQGNVWQWCQEDWRSYPVSGEVKATEDIEDIRDISDRNSRVLRGGAFHNLPDGVRCAYRNLFRPSNRNNPVGFRVARTYP